MAWILVLAASILPPVDAPVRTLPPAVVAPVGTLATAVELPVDTIALAIQALGTMLTAILLGTCRSSIKTTINAVSPLVQSLFYAIAAFVEMPLDPVTRIGEGGSIEQQAGSGGANQCPQIHDVSPGFLTSSQQTTATRHIG